MGVQTVFVLVDIIGIFVGAVAGALVGRRMHYDIMGIWVLALVSGLGGGVVRDLMLAEGPPLALTDPFYLPTVLAGAMLAAVVGPHIDRLKPVINVLDTLSIGSFAVAGALRTIDAGLSPWSVVLLGVITAVGGGILRDVMTGQTPAVFRQGDLYAIAAIGGCIVVLICRELGLPREVNSVLGIATTSFLRLGSQRWGWMSWQPR